jgi:hypothetical protein
MKNCTEFTSHLEPLEARIAPAAVFTYTDIDGDIVTIKTSKGTDAQLAAILTFSDPSAANPRQLQEIDFSANASVFAGTGLSVTAKRSIETGGNGAVNVGYVDATDVDGGTSLVLGKVVVEGDLGRISAKAADNTGAAIQSLAVQSFGAFGTATQAAGGSLVSDMLGGINSFIAKGSIFGARISVDGKSSSVFVGGSLIGGSTANSGALSFTGDVKSIRIDGDLIGGTGIASGLSGSLSVGGKAGVVTIGGSIIGGDGGISGSISIIKGTGSLILRGSLLGGDGGISGSITLRESVGKLTILGSILGGDGSISGSISAPDTLGALRIGGSIVGGGGAISASVTAGNILSSIKIGGSIEGSSGAISGSVSVLEGVKAFVVGGSVLGGLGDGSGSVSFNAGNVQSIRIAGSIAASPLSGGGGTLNINADVKLLQIGGDIVGGSASGTDSLSQAGFVLAKSVELLVIGGSVIAGTDDTSGTFSNNGAVRILNDVGSLVVQGSLVGNATNPVLITARGQETPTGTKDIAIGSLKIGGSALFTRILGGYDASGSTIGGDGGTNADAQIGKVAVRGDWIASSLTAGVSDNGDGFGNADALLAGVDVKNEPGVVSRIASIVIEGQISGTTLAGDHYGLVAQQLGKLNLSGDAVALQSGPSNDNLAFSDPLLLFAATLDVRAREV